MKDRQEVGTVEFGTLSRHFRIRLLNCSANGCLIETSTPVAVGTVAMLEVSVGERSFSEAVQVIRCQSITGAGGVHHVAARLLPTTPPYRGSLRFAMRWRASDLSGWMTTSEDE